MWSNKLFLIVHRMEKNAKMTNKSAFSKFVSHKKSHLKTFTVHYLYFSVGYLLMRDTLGVGISFIHNCAAHVCTLFSSTVNP
jgi:hypothetical protein